MAAVLSGCDSQDPGDPRLTAEIVGSDRYLAGTESAIEFTNRSRHTPGSDQRVLYGAEG